MSRRLVSNYSAYWAMYGLNTYYLDFTIDREVIPTTVKYRLPKNYVEPRYISNCNSNPKYVFTDAFPCPCGHLDIHAHCRKLRRFSIFYFPNVKNGVASSCWNQLVRNCFLLQEAICMATPAKPNFCVGLDCSDRLFVVGCVGAGTSRRYPPVHLKIQSRSAFLSGPISIQKYPG